MIGVRWSMQSASQPAGQVGPVRPVGGWQIMGEEECWRDVCFEKFDDGLNVNGCWMDRCWGSMVARGRAVEEFFCAVFEVTNGRLNRMALAREFR